MEAIQDAGREPIRDAYPEGRWLTYSELAEIRGIGRPSAVKLVKREKWRRIPGNDRDRTVRVLVPPEWLQPSVRDAIPDHTPDALPELAAANARADEAGKRADAALALADRTLAQLADAGTRADAAEARSAANVQRADRAEARAEQERLAADRFRREMEDAQQAARTALGRIQAAEATEAARKGKGRWRRAWDGWRGR